MGSPDETTSVWQLEHAAQLAALVEQGVRHDEEARFHEARATFEQALTLVSDHLGEDHLEAAPLHLRLAMILHELEAWARALHHHRLSLAIYERERGSMDSLTARAHNNFGVYYWRLAQPTQALEHFQKAFDIFESNHGRHHHATADVIENIAMIHHMLGNPARAAELAEESARIKETAIGKIHSSTAKAYNNAGAYHYAAGNLERARNLLFEALEVRRELHGPQHPYTTSTLDNVAQLEQALGQFAAAQEHYEQALESNLITFGETHHETGRVLNNLGSLLNLQDRSNEAIPYLMRARAAFETVGGLAHPRTLDVIFNLAEAHRNLKQFTEAFNLFRQALKAYLEFQETAFINLDAAGKLQYNTQARLWLGSYFKCVHAAQNGSTSLPETFEALTFWASFKGSATAFETTWVLAQERADAETKQSLETLAALRRELAQCVVQLPDPASRDEHRSRLEALKARVSRQEQTLSRTLLEFQHDLDLRQVRASDLLEALRPGELCIDFALAGEQLYAFTISVQSGVRLHDLGPSAPVVAMLEVWRATLHAGEDDASGAAAHLTQSIIAPFQLELADAHSLVVIPDGWLHFTPFELLGGGISLLERMPVRTVPTGRDLVRLHRHSRQHEALEPPALFGDPDFLNAEATTYRSSPALESSSATFIDWVQQLHLPRLPHSRSEVNAIQQRLGEARVFLGSEASEAALLSLRRPRLLHLATHGLIFDSETPVPSPLLRVLLALSGARWSVLNGGSAGLVSALHLCGLDLRGTQLVVLSGCNTALGAAQAGEGVAGLAQVLMGAGAQGLIHGLWRVEDRTTAKFMDQFYERFAAGLAPLEALRLTKLDWQHRHPHEWAGFVFSGAAE
jgi:CHAT domain-containing protein/Tfp pilus assembly protein PilF